MVCSHNNRTRILISKQQDQASWQEQPKDH